MTTNFKQALRDADKFYFPLFSTPSFLLKSLLPPPQPRSQVILLHWKRKQSEDPLPTASTHLPATKAMDSNWSQTICVPN